MSLTSPLGAAYGWRARIGLLQPGVVSDTNPFEFYLMAPDGVQLVLTSLGLGGMSVENYERAIGALETPVRRLLDRHVDAIIQTGIPPLVTAGWGIEEQLKERVAQLTSTPYLTDAAASILALRALKATRIAVVSGFDDDLVKLIEQYMTHADIDVVAHARVPNDGRIPLETVYRAAKTLFMQNVKKIDALWITMASIPSVAVIDRLESDTGVPVVSSAQALMWAGLHAAGVPERVLGFGRLFATSPGEATFEIGLA